MKVDPAAVSPFWTDVSGFYHGVGYGLVVLVLPVVLWTLPVSGGLAALGRRAGVRIGSLLSFTFILAFALVGCVSGAIAGATLESIVGASLAAILAIVSSMLAWLFGKETLRAWRPVIPLALIALLTSTLAGLVIGGSRRTQVIRERAEVDDARYLKQTVDIAAQREMSLALARKCVEGKTYDEALEQCDAQFALKPEP